MHIFTRNAPQLEVNIPITLDAFEAEEKRKKKKKKLSKKERRQMEKMVRNSVLCWGIFLCVCVCVEESEKEKDEEGITSLTHTHTHTLTHRASSLQRATRMRQRSLRSQ